VEVLQAQNGALRMAAESSDRPNFSMSAAVGSPHGSRPHHLPGASEETKKDLFTTAGRGHTLGEPPNTVGGAGAMDDYRQQMHAKWENEKKLTKRVSVLEKRLQEKVEENEDLQNQLQRARDTTQSAINTRDEMQKKVAGAAKLASEARKLTTEDLVAVKEAQSRIFELEEENARLRRKLDVEEVNKV
jgi:predicted RNase H-like nuclease (RuvC/YqgF family)